MKYSQFTFKESSETTGTSTCTCTLNHKQKTAETEILEQLSTPFDDITRDDSIAAAMFHGAPGSGKTFLLWQLFLSLKQRYPDNGVYFVSAIHYSTPESRDVILDKLVFRPRCIVLLDDAHLWWSEQPGLFGIFKGTGRILVAAAATTKNNAIWSNYSCRVHFQSIHCLDNDPEP